jgi:hypothetical protein
MHTLINNLGWNNCYEIKFAYPEKSDKFFRTKIFLLIIIDKLIAKKAILPTYLQRLSLLVVK